MRFLMVMLVAAACGAPESEWVERSDDFAVDEVAPSPIVMDLTVDPFVTGGTTDLFVTGATPHTRVWFFASQALGAGPCRAHTCLDIVRVSNLGNVRADANGDASLSVAVPAFLAEGDVVLFQTAQIRGAAGTSQVVRSIVGSDVCPTVDPNDPLAARFEGVHFDNMCVQDSDCMVGGGCSGEVCAAVPAFSTCEGLPYLPQGDCMCVNNECLWADVCP